MKQMRELRTYVSGVAAAPILIMLLNETVLITFLGFASSLSFVFTISMIIFYIVSFGRGWFDRIKGKDKQLLVKTTLVNLPILPAGVSLITMRNVSDFIPLLFAYIFFGVIACIYQIIVGGRVSALHRITFFFLGYILALIAYTGSLAGQQAGQGFSLLRAFDNLSGVASVFSLIGDPIPLPLAGYVRFAMMLAIPAITFSSLAAQLRQTEVRDSPTSEPRLVTSLRPAVALLTVSSVITMFPVLLLARMVAEHFPFLATILPTLFVALVVISVVLISE
ncbi:MAG: hypothetical protein HYY67_06555 [Thaumarchaeota archaeon]|nr:hypothetical protein [Nitrososphaerota archaeon]